MNVGKSIQLIKLDKRVEQFIYEYDGRGKHSIILKDGFRFSNTESCQDIGTLKELMESLKSYVETTYPCENELNGGERCDTACPSCHPKYSLKQ